MRHPKTLLAWTAALALVALPGCQDPEPEKFGSIKIELNAADPETSPFSGTSEIVVVLQYQQCLQDFYLIHHSEYQETGVKGGDLFAEWAEKLCDSDLEKVIDCEVTDITQTLIESTNVFQLRVTYSILDPESLQLGYIHVGPLPTEDFTDECDDLPTVSLGSTGVIGRDSGGSQLWGIDILPGSTEAVAGQGAPLRIDIELN